MLLPSFSVNQHIVHHSVVNLPEPSNHELDQKSSPLDLLLVSCVQMGRCKHSLELGGGQQFEDAQRSVDYFPQSHPPNPFLNLILPTHFQKKMNNNLESWSK